MMFDNIDINTELDESKFRTGKIERYDVRDIHKTKEKIYGDNMASLVDWSKEYARNSYQKEKKPSKLSTDDKLLIVKSGIDLLFDN